MNLAIYESRSSNVHDQVKPGAVRTSHAAEARERWKLHNADIHKEESSSHADEEGKIAMRASYNEVEPGAMRTSHAAEARERWKLHNSDRHKDESSSHTDEEGKYNAMRTSYNEAKPGAVRTSNAAAARERWKLHNADMHRDEQGEGRPSNNGNVVKPGVVRTSNASTARERWKLKNSDRQQADTCSNYEDEGIALPSTPPGAVRASTAATAREQWKVRRSGNPGVNSSEMPVDDVTPGASNASRASTAREQWKLRNSETTETAKKTTRNSSNFGDEAQPGALCVSDALVEKGVHPETIIEMPENDFGAHHPSTHGVNHWVLEDAEDCSTTTTHDSDHEQNTDPSADEEQPGIPVTDDQYQQQENQQKLDGTNKEQSRIKARRRCKCCIALSVIVVVVIAVVVVAVLVVDSSGNNGGGGRNKDNVSSDGTTSSSGDDSAQSGLSLEEFDFQNDILPNMNADMTLLLQDPTSAQSQALQWLLNDPWYGSATSDSDSSDVGETYYYSNERKLRRFLFATFYFSTEGRNWNQQNGDHRWLSYGTDECQWFTTNSSTSLCEDFSLRNLRGGILRGRIPQEMFFLSALKKIDLRDNALHGALPSLLLPNNNSVASLLLKRNTPAGDGSVGGTSATQDTQAASSWLTSLEYVSLRNNSISGSIPSDWFLLSSLSHFDVSMNNVSGTIAKEIGFASSLRYLALHQNSLVGTVPSQIASLQDIEHLALNDNALSGPLPMEELSFLPNLRNMYLDQNLFTGSIPTTIGLASGLEWFLVNDNRLNGTIPTHIGLLTNAQVISLRGNRNIHGTIPIEIQNLNNLQMLLLNDMSLVGPLPLSELQSLTNLRTLYLHNNNNYEIDDGMASIARSNSVSSSSSSPLLLSMADNETYYMESNATSDSSVLSLEEVCNLFLHASSLEQLSIDCYHPETTTSLSWSCVDPTTTANTATIACTNFTSNNDSLVYVNENPVTLDACVCQRS